MSTVIRDGVIRISIQQGTVELKAPDLGPIIAQRKQEVAVIDQMTAAINAGAAAEEQSAQVRVAEIEKTKAVAAEAARQQEEATMRIARSQIEMNEGIMRTGTGFLQLGRSVALFTSSDKDLQQLVQTLATFQAGLDAVRGGADVIAGFIKITEQIAVARKAAAAATTIETGAIALNTTATNTNTAAQTSMIAAMAAANPVLLAVMAALAAAAVAYKVFGDSAEEAERKSREATEANVAAGMEREAMMRRNIDVLKEFVSEQDRQKQLAERVIDADLSSRGAQNTIDIHQNSSAQMDSEASKIDAGVSALQELYAIEQRKSDEKQRGLDIQVKEIENQQRIAEAAQKQLDIEKKKVEAFEAQFGLLDKGEQKRLTKITDQIRAGDTAGLRQSDVEFLAQRGGGQGQALAQEEFARRGRAQGADSIFAGIANPALEQANDIANREQGKLDKLTEGKGVGEALEGIEDERQAIIDGMTKMQKDFRKVIEPMLESMEALSERSKQIQAAIRNG